VLLSVLQGTKANSVVVPVFGHPVYNGYLALVLAQALHLLKTEGAEVSRGAEGGGEGQKIVDAAHTELVVIMVSKDQVDVILP
jgi:hypothetical protein